MKKKRRVKFFNIHRSKIIDRTLFKRKKVRPSRRKHETVQLLPSLRLNYSFISALFDSQDSCVKPSKHDGT